LAKPGCFFNRIEFLVVKLIAREPEDFKPFVFVLFIQFLKPRKLGSQAAFARRVDDQQYFPREILQRLLLPVGFRNGKVMYRGHGTPSFLRSANSLLSLIMVKFTLNCKYKGGTEKDIGGKGD
jgi:hypothetical protein